MLKFKLQYFAHLMRRAGSLEKTLMLRKIESRRRRGRQTMRWLDGITDSMDINLSESWWVVKDREAWHAADHGVTKGWTQLSDWTATVELSFIYSSAILFIKQILKGALKDEPLQKTGPWSPAPGV